MVLGIEWHHVIESLAVLGIAGAVTYLRSMTKSVSSIGVDVHVIKTNDLPHIQTSMTEHATKLGDLEKAFIRHLDRPHTSREGDE